MIIGTIPPHALREVQRACPVRQREAAREYGIDLSSVNLLHGADTWIYCRQAWPHTDRHFAGKVFITLTVRGAYEFGLAYEGGDHRCVYVPPGILWAFDPCVTHWLYPARLENPRAYTGWIGLQWEAPIRSAKHATQRIMRDLTGKWAEDMGKLASWRPAG